jgi:hypothetical protein
MFAFVSPRLALHALALADDSSAHHFLCHSDGSACEDGCDRRADPVRLAAYLGEPIGLEGLYDLDDDTAADGTRDVFIA